MGECPMIRLSPVIEQFESDFLHQYADRLLPSQRKALAAMKACRNRYSPLMQAHCDTCDSDQYFPHSCGNRHCPHCQHHESQQWLENQCRKQVPVNYFMITFTVPAQLRNLFFRHQRQCYGLLFESAWDTLQTFSQDGNVTFRYLDSKSKQYQNKTVSGADFLWLVLQHVLPRGFCRARNYGFLHPNSKILIKLLTLVFHFDPARFLKKQKPRSQLICVCCSKPMQIVKTRIDRITRHVLVPV